MTAPPPEPRAEGATAAFDARDALLLGALALLFVASRLLWLVAHPETASYWEESYRWIAMHELLHGPVQPFLEYQADHYNGGSLVMILLGLPGFVLFGESVLTFKLPALCVSTATLALLYVVGRRHFGRAVGVLSALAYLAGPPLVAYWGLAVMGFHGEAAFLGLVQVACFLELLRGGRRGALAHAAFGFACGFGIWFCYVAALSAAACLLTGLRLLPRPTLRELAGGVVGLSAGLLPWLAYNATRGFVGVARVLEVFGLRESADPWEEVGAVSRGIELLLSDLPRGILDPSGVLSGGAGALVQAGYLIPMGAGLALSAARVAPVLLRSGRAAGATRAGGEAVFPVYVAIWLVAYLASRLTPEFEAHPIGYRVLTPLAVLCVPPLAISAADGLARGGATRALALLAALAFLLASGAATLAFAFRSDAGATLSLDLGYRTFGRLAHRKYEPDLRRVVAPLRRIPDVERREAALWGVGWAVQARLELGGTLREVLSRMRHLPEAERLAILHGAIWAANERLPVLHAEARGGDAEARHRLARTRALARFARERLEEAGEIDTGRDAD